MSDKKHLLDIRARHVLRAWDKWVDAAPESYIYPLTSDRYEMENLKSKMDNLRETLK